MKCPFKDTMAPAGEDGTGADVAAGVADEGPSGVGGLGGGKSSYVPPHLRNGGGGAGEKLAGTGKFERDDLATLRVTNVSTSSYLLARGDTNSRYRSQKWQKSTSYEIYSNGSVVSRVSFWQRTGRLVWRRDLLSSRIRIEQMLSRLRIRWMDLVSSI